MTNGRDAPLDRVISYGQGAATFSPPGGAIEQFLLSADEAVASADIEMTRAGRLPEVWAALFTRRLDDEARPVWVLRWTDVTVMPSIGRPRDGHVLEVLDAQDGSRVSRIEAGGAD